MTPTKETIQAMNPLELLDLVIQATGTHAVAALNKSVEPLIEDKELPLEGYNTGFATGPCPIPFGILRGREDLGPLAINVSVRVTVEPAPEGMLVKTDPSEDKDAAPDTAIITS